MPDQYGPYRNFKKNLDELKAELRKAKDRQQLCRERTNGCGDALMAERIQSLSNAISIMEQ